MLLLRSLAAIPAALHPIKPPGASVFQDQQQTAAAAPPQIAAAPPQAPARQQPTEPTQSSTAHAQQPTEALQSRAAAPQQEQLPPTEPTQSSTADAQQPTEALQSRAAAPQQEQLPTEPTQSSTADAQQPTETLQSSAPAPQQTAAPSQSTEQDAQQHAPRAPFAVLVEALQSGRMTPDNLATFVASLTAPTPTPPPSPAAEVKIEPGATSVVAASAEPVAAPAPEPKASSPAAPMPASMLAPGQLTEQRFNSSTHPNQWRKFERFCENNEHASELKKMYSLEAELLITVAVALYPGILTHESLHVCPAEEGRSDQIGGIREIREGELCLG